jgi:pilus assembly protein CpaB
VDNLRNKLRDRASVEDAPVKARRAPAKKGRGKPRRPAEDSAGKGIGGLDVNRKLLFTAIGIAALASLIAVTYLGDLSEGILDGGTKVEVYVPTEDIPARRQIDGSMVELKAFPKALLPAGALTEEKDVIGKVALAPVVKGEVLHAKRLSAANAITGLAPKLKPNERGFLFVPEGANDIALVKPDDKVDLTATIQTPSGYLSTKIVQKARVMSVGNQFSNQAAPKTEDGESEAAASRYGELVTLAVPAGKISLLAALKQQGNLSMSLRAPGDESETPPEVSEADLARYVLGTIPRAAAPKPVTPPPQPRPVQVRPRPAAPPPQPKPVVPKPQLPQVHIMGTGN